MNDIYTYYKEKNYIVTNSKNDNSVLKWSVNIEKNKLQHPNIYFKLVINPLNYLEDFVLLSRKILSLYCKDKLCKYLFLLKIIVI